jgi:hypothetical protein
MPHTKDRGWDGRGRIIADKQITKVLSVHLRYSIFCCSLEALAECDHVFKLSLLGSFPILGIRLELELAHFKAEKYQPKCSISGIILVGQKFSTTFCSSE